MAKPRRAVRRVSGRVLWSSALVGITAVATLAVWQMSDTDASVALPAAEESAVIETPPAPSTDVSSTPEPSSSSTPEPSSSSTPTASVIPSANGVDWIPVVAGCQQTVAARDAVISRAAAGIDHWSQHVQAQTDANAGRISVAQMKKSFMRTRLLGPSDVSRYRDALGAAALQRSSCSTPKGASTEVATILRRCSDRQSAQNTALLAGARGMRDWSSHLAAMRRSKHGHVDNAQRVWIDAWRAAPPNIEAFDQASAKLRSAAVC